jgi:hypothetical protein
MPARESVIKVKSHVFELRFGNDYGDPSPMNRSRAASRLT